MPHHKIHFIKSPLSMSSEHIERYTRAHTHPYKKKVFTHTEKHGPALPRTENDGRRGWYGKKWMLKKSYGRINFNCGTPINVVLMRHHKILLLAFRTMQMDLRGTYKSTFTHPIPSGASRSIGERQQ